MKCPACRRALVVPQPDSGARADEADDEPLFWKRQRGQQPDPSSPEEQEYQRSRRRRARPPGWVRLWGGVWMVVGTVLVLAIQLLAVALEVRGRVANRVAACAAILAGFIVVKGWLELVTGKSALKTFYLADDPTRGWREFLSWLFVLASAIAIFVLLVVASVTVGRF